jgi:hypothetical protein
MKTIRSLLGLTLILALLLWELAVAAFRTLILGQTAAQMTPVASEDSPFALDL